MANGAFALGLLVALVGVGWFAGHSTVVVPDGRPDRSDHPARLQGPPAGGPRWTVTTMSVPDRVPDEWVEAFRNGR
ncbi:MAG: hypothetical protein ABSF84_05820 [Acidimicrobiales bacterium]